jgi:hypothetical protein
MNQQRPDRQRVLQEVRDIVHNHTYVGLDTETSGLGAR